MKIKWTSAALAAAFLISVPGPAAAEVFAPYGTAKLDLHTMPVTNTVFDVNYEDPKQLRLLHSFIRNTWKETKGKVVVVTHGPELRAFAKENYDKYQAIIDDLADLAQEGVEFKMCHNALRAAGYSVEDMHGFITVVPAGFPEIVYWMGQGYQYVNPIPYSVAGVRYIDQPQLQKQD